MGNEAGEWIMSGLPDNHPECVHNFEELTVLVGQKGFLPLFRNAVDGFSVEKYANPVYWWSGDAERDPWEWRKEAARSRKMAYGKFFGGKAGIISLEWLPVFLSYRRNGYDFEALWYAGQAQFRQKKIMDCLTDEPELLDKVKKYISVSDFTYEIYRRAAERVFYDIESGSLNPAAVVDMFDEEEQTEIAGLFQASMPEMNTDEERRRAFFDIIIRVKENSYNKFCEENANDLSKLKESIELKKELENLKRKTIDV